MKRRRTQPSVVPKQILPYEPTDIPLLAQEAQDLHLYTTDERVWHALREIIEDRNRYLYGRYVRSHQTTYDPKGAKELALFALIHELLKGNVILPEK